MPTKLATLLPALCALTLAAGLLACSTSESNSRAGAPGVGELAHVDTAAITPFRLARIALGKGFEVRVDESGLWASTPYGGEECGGARVEVTYVVTHLDRDEVKTSGDACQFRRYVKTLELPSEVPTRARLVCDTWVPSESDAGETACDAIVGSFVLADAPAPGELAGLEAPEVRERVVPALFNAPGEHEVFVPGADAWMPYIYVGSVDLGLPGEVFVVGSDRIASGVFLSFLFENEEGMFVENELDYVDGRLWAGPLSDGSGQPADLFAQVRDESAEGPVQRCVRYAFSEGFYQPSSESCPDVDARGRLIYMDGPSAAEQPAPAKEATDAPPEDPNRYTRLHFEMTIEVDGDVKSRPQSISMPGMPVTVSQNGGGERPVQFLLEMTPTFVGENIALAGTIEGKVGEEVAYAQAIDAQVALGEPMAIAFELDGMAYVIEMVVQKSEYQRENSVRQ
ncbi:hypothetical protein FRC98_09625 [Lujinxingia vulgaris]|uniref:Uncharacterized protein n=1 Tax=Lujinxingia vulgaris TaxID=2600176 RepID=A0A5C6XCI6_9DELT|nr:hypothetical protein [Lujinxingia vulgaris]TXD36991.1 hypothetical protein FRC98_09625 [Lujinxingia vulgaris]